MLVIKPAVVGLSIVTAATLADVPDMNWWTSMPFAMGCSAFLVWSLVQLALAMFKAYQDANTKTVDHLREELGRTQGFTRDKLLVTLDSVTRSLDSHELHQSEARQTIQAVRDTLVELLGEVHLRPCLLEASPEERQRALKRLAVVNSPSSQEAGK